MTITAQPPSTALDTWNLMVECHFDHVNYDSLGSRAWGSGLCGSTIGEGGEYTSMNRDSARATDVT